MKFAIVLLALTAALFSCAQNDPAETSSYGDVEIMNDYAGYVDTVWEKKTDFSKFKTSEEASFFITRPEACVTEEKAYLIRNFPDELPDGYASYDDYVLDGSPGRPYEIEVYDAPDYTSASETIPLAWMEETSFVPHDLYYNEGDTLTVVGSRNGETCLYEINMDGEPIYETSLHFAMPGDAEDFFYTGYAEDCFYVMSKEGASLYTLTRRNVKTGEETVVDTGIELARVQEDFVFYIKKIYPSLNSVAVELYRWNPADASGEQIGQTAPCSLEDDPWFGLWSVFYDETGGSVYLCAHDSVTAYNVESDEYRTVFDVLDASLEVEQFLNGKILLSLDRTQLSVYEISSDSFVAEQDVQTLRICWYSGTPTKFSERYKEVLKIMKADGVSVQIEEILDIDRADEYVNTVAKKLLSGDEDFDLVYVDTGTSGLMDERYYCDLSQFDVLEKPLSALKDSVRELCAVNGVQVFVPLSLSSTALRIDASALSDVAALPQTFDELVKFRETVSAELADKNIRFLLGTTGASVCDPWFDQIVANYMSGVADDETAKEDLEKVFAFGLDVLKANATAGETSLASAVTSSGSRIRAAEGTSVIFVPKLRAEYGDVFDAGYVAINPNSAKKELAALLLAYCMEYDRTNGAAGVSCFYSSETDATGENALFDAQLENGVRNYEIADLYVLTNEKFTELQNGKSSVEEAAEAIFRYIKMARDE